MKEERKKFTALFIFGILLFLLVFAFESLPVLNGNVSNSINNTDLQKNRILAFEKNMLILVYSADEIEKTQAKNDIAIIIPLFETEQNMLSQSYYDDIQLLAISTRSDYLFLDTTIKKQAFTVSDINLFLPHANAYTTVLNQIVFSIQNHMSSGFFYLFCIEIGIQLLISGIFIYFFFKIKKEYL